MDRINRIVSHPLWRETVKDIQELEKTRIFCGHNVAHFMDVARLCEIENLRDQLGISREMIYAAALLHDIGRAKQYREGIPHDVAGAALAEEILRDCGFDEAEIREITGAISRHRSRETGEKQDLAGLLYRADKAARLCRFCEAQAECNWSPEKKNLVLKD